MYCCSFVVLGDFLDLCVLLAGVWLVSLLFSSYVCCVFYGAFGLVLYVYVFSFSESVFVVATLRWCWFAVRWCWLVSCCADRTDVCDVLF